VNLVVKALISLTIILTAVAVGKRWPTLGGLIAVMPLSGLLVLVWLHLDSHGDRTVMEGYTRGALFGLLPTAGFFAVALLAVRKGWPLSLVLLAGFAVWGAAALAHQWWLR